MITFVAPFPAPGTEKDGMIQRVAAIDALVADQPRQYIELSIRRQWRAQTTRPSPRVVWHRLNIILHFPRVLRLLLASNTTYVHSVFCALHILPFYFFKSIITDMHGVVPEETELLGSPGRARIFAIVERIVVRRSRALVMVTEAMRRHYLGKYGETATTTIILPIFAPPDLSDEGDNARAADLVIYAGGLQDWQNVPLMINAARQVTGLRFQFLTGDPAKLRQLLEQAGVASIDVRSVPHAEVAQYCRRAGFGFVLRDDITVNRVACPTKLVEYLSYGVVPVVLSKEIGDFNMLGFACVTLDDLLAGRLPDVDQLAVMRQRNRHVVRTMQRLVEQGQAELRRLLA